jgi:hypothetical protein
MTTQEGEDEEEEEEEKEEASAFPPISQLVVTADLAQSNLP